MGLDHDTIIAPATASGGALAVVRVSGSDAFAVCDRLFRGRTRLADADGYTVHFGRIVDGDRLLDEVLATVFRAPHSYTGENTVELSCHGSPHILSELLRLLLAAGARMAAPGEFTLRAYFAGKLDLAQAEAVADLIAASSRAEHALAANQMRGGYSAALDGLRDRLLHLASMLELELDFGEEEVEFADRTELQRIMEQIEAEISKLQRSFALGNVLKEGVPVALVGAPNAGKSTLLNRLLHEERALVSEIAGTTRDVIEETVDLGGIRFRFVDTAGIRTTDDRLERMGIERTLDRIARARIVVRIIDAEEVTDMLPPLDFALPEGASLVTVVSKTDLRPEFAAGPDASSEGAGQASASAGEDQPKGMRSLPEGVIGLSARTGEGVDALCRRLLQEVDAGALERGETVVSNGRHYEALTAAHEALDRALTGLRTDLPTDLLAEEVRQVIRHLGEITGRGIVSDDILANIFSKFCIGK